MAGGVIGIDDWNQILKDHGQPITRKQSPDKIKDRYGREKDDPYPTVEYTFKDGSSITMKGIPSTDSGPASVSWSVVDQKGVLNDSSSTKAPTTRNIGGHVQQWDNATQQWIDPPGVDNTTAGTPKDTVPGTGTTATPGTLDQNGDPVGATPGTPDVPVDVYTAQNNAKNDETARRIAQQNADTAKQNADETARQNEITNAREEAKNYLTQIHQQNVDGIAAGQLSLDQAKQNYTEAHDKVTDWLTQRTQDITARGQALDYLGKQSYVTKGQYESLQGAEGQLAQTGGVGFTPSPTPPGLGYDPQQLAASLAQQALGQTQQVNQPFSMGQASAQAPANGTPQGFVPPSFESGGQQTNNPGTPPLAVAARR